MMVKATACSKCISVDADRHAFIRTRGSFSDEGFRNGHLIQTSGFRDDTNNTEYRITLVTPKELFANGAPMANEVSGARVVIQQGHRYPRPPQTDRTGGPP